MARSNFQDVAFEERHTMLGLLLSIIAIGAYTVYGVQSWFAAHHGVGTAA